MLQDIPDLPRTPEHVPHGVGLRGVRQPRMSVDRRRECPLPARVSICWRIRASSEPSIVLLYSRPMQRTTLAKSAPAQARQTAASFAVPAWHQPPATTLAKTARARQTAASFAAPAWHHPPATLAKTAHGRQTAASFADAAWLPPVQNR